MSASLSYVVRTRTRTPAIWPAICSVAARLMERTRGPSQEPVSGREREVLRLVARGASNREVARALFVSEATIKSHLINVYRKLGVTDRTAAVTAALERGLIALGDGEG
jgi:ATP/maltotriose-dependent transcriptional regulator MalT